MNGTSIIAHTGESAHSYFERIRGRAPVDETEVEDEPEDKFTLLETGIPLGELSATQKRIWGDAEKAGFTMRGYESRVWFADTVQKTDGKVKKDGTQVLAGEITKPAFEARNIFLGGYVPQSALRFHASWLDGKFFGFVWDPIGRYRYANSQAADTRETYWVIRGSVEFEQWLDEWRERMTGKSRRLDKEQEEARKQAKRDAIYQDYLDHQNNEGIYTKEAAHG